MVTRNSPWPEGTPCWVDLAVDDFGKGQRFYAGLFGWEVPEGEAEFGGYSTATKDGHAVAGIAPKMSPDQPSVWTVYLAVEDVEATAAKVLEQGGRVVAEPMTVAEFGKMAIFADPGGAVAGLWQSGSNTGAELANEPGSLVWSENLSRAWKQNQDFYAQVLGYEYDDMSGEGFEYASFRVAGEKERPAGGIGQMGDDWPAEVPPHWNNYFKVTDTAAACEQVKQLGGTVLREPWDTPFGTMALVTDDQGAAFMLMGDNEQTRS